MPVEGIFSFVKTSCNLLMAYFASRWYLMPLEGILCIRKAFPYHFHNYFLLFLINLAKNFSISSSTGSRSEYTALSVRRRRRSDNVRPRDPRAELHDNTGGIQTEQTETVRDMRPIGTRHERLSRLGE